MHLKPRDGAAATSGHWVYTVADFATEAECASLLTAADVRIASVGAADPDPRYRLPIATKLDGVYVDTILTRRLLAMVEERLPELAQLLFGQTQDLADMPRTYSPGEPAVNVYYPGGGFKPHTDKQALTMLIPLSPSDAFDGGGTAFWSGRHQPHGEKNGSVEYDEADEARWLPHDQLLKPKAGTAILFGGDVTHAGLPVTRGIRHLFVVSFTLRPSKRLAVAPPSTPEELRAMMLRERAAEEATVVSDASSADALAAFADLFASDSDDEYRD